MGSATRRRAAKRDEASRARGQAHGVTSVMSNVVVPSLHVRRCGQSELRLPLLGMGCWAYGGGSYWGQQSQREVDEMVRHAVDHGCTFFDTAEAYNGGTSESSLGEALRGIPRDRVIIGTKISPSNTEAATLVEHCEASLRRLQTDYIDLYMVHWPITAHAIRHFADLGPRVPSVAGAFETLQRLQREGKIRHIGVSNFGTAKLVEALATGATIVANELPYSLLTRAIELDVLPFCRANGIGVLGYMTLLQGVLSDKYATLAEMPEMRRRTRHFSRHSTPLSRHGTEGAEAETMAALQGIRAYATTLQMSTSELALKWAFAGQGITSCLCGSRNVRALQDNLSAAMTPLPNDVVAELNRITQPLLHQLGPSFDYYENPANDRTK
jgi:aryl-alcohol dehydrogenase-like predicted oxidoreductase